MPKLRRLSGKDVAAILRRFHFEVESQRGSHLKLGRLLSSGEHQTLTIPNHAELDTGTCRAILRQASRYIPEEELALYFYSR